MAVTVASVSTASPGNASSVVVTKPTGLAVGDLMIAHYTFQDATDTMGTLSGWTHPVSNQNAGGTVYMGLQYKIATSGDVAASDFTFTLDGLVANPVVAISRITGYRTDDLLNFDLSSVQANTGSPTFDCEVTSTMDSSLLLLFVSSNDSSATPGVSAYAVANNNPTWTEQYDIGVNTTHNCAMASAPYTSITTTGNPSATVNGSGTQDPRAILVSISSTVNYESSSEVYVVGPPATITKPTGVAIGDVLLLFVFGKWNTGFNATCTGFTQLESANTGGEGGTLLYRIADASDVSAANYSVTNGQTEIQMAYMLRVSGAYTGAFQTSSQVVTTGIFTTMDITPTYANSLIVFGVWNYVYTGTLLSGWAIDTSNPTWTVAQEDAGNNGNAFGSSGVVYGTRPEVTSTGNFNITDPGTEQIGMAIVIAPKAQAQVSPAVIELTTSILSPSVSGGASVTVGAALSAVASVIEPTFSSPAEDWTNQTKNTSTWTNQSKS